MKIRAIFIDMDGTLLKSSNTISYRNIEAIEKLKKQGTKVFLATGRHYEITAPYHKELGLNTPMICLNGAAVYEAKTGIAKQMKTVKVNEERFHRLTSVSTYHVLIHTTNGLYCNQTNEEIDSWTKVAKIPPKYVGDLRRANYQNVLKYSVWTDAPSYEISEQFKKEAEVIDWEDGFEIVAPNTSKWSAINNLLTELQIHPKEVAAIGDGPNDIAMLRNAGIGVAMENASEKVKAAADIVTGHHDMDGLAEFIERYLLKSFNSYAI